MLHDPASNIIPLHRGVRPIPQDHLRMVDPFEVNDFLAPWAHPQSYRLDPVEKARIAKVIADERRDRLQRFIGVACVGVAAFAFIYFFFQLGFRGGF